MLHAPRKPFLWQLRTRSLPLGERTLIMGIVNVTPDSFSDGGQHATLEAALQHALQLLDDGADILDLGGESTRPGSAAGTDSAISEDVEQQRVLPLLEAILRTRPGTVLSVDTYRASTAQLALERGAEIINDVSGMQWDPDMARVCAQARCGIVAMHTRGLPSQWSTLPRLAEREILPLILKGLRATATHLVETGCNRNAIVLDPGFGFGKRGNENRMLLEHFSQFNGLGYPLLAGLSRKRFLRGDENTMCLEELDAASASASVTAALAGAHIVRVHNVVTTARALVLCDSNQR